MRELDNYANGKIYRIVCSITKKVYIGSTAEINLNNRLRSHAISYTKYLKTGGHYLSSFDVLEHNAYTIEQIEEYPCESRQELCAREGELQLLFRCVNKNFAGRNAKSYYKDNQERIIESSKQYKLKHSEKYNALITCACCNHTYKFSNKYYHKKSKKHLRQETY
jgi:hypothetical protein